MKFIPHTYQAYATERILDTPFIALLLDMGLGKTVSTLTAVEQLIYDRMETGKVLIIAPLRVAEDTWPREVAKWDHLRHLTYSKVLGDVAQRRRALAASADLYIINRENVPWLVTEYGRKWPFKIVIVDELSSFKSPTGKRFKALRKVRPLIDRLVGLTGTPAPNGLEDLWAPIFLLDRGERLGNTVTAYRERFFYNVAKPGAKYLQLKPKKETESAIYETISDIAVSMRAEDWLQMPERLDVPVPIRLSPDAMSVYKRLERTLVAELAGKTITAATAAVLSNKLLQMASGAVYDEDRGVQTLHTAKLDALEDIVEAVQGRPLMVLYNYKHSLSRLQERFPQARVLRKGSDGNQDIEDWNNDRIPILFLHPQSAGHGLNLQYSRCQTVVWYDQIWSLEYKQQADARVYRQGQTRSVVIMSLIAEGTMDEEAAAAQERKANDQNLLMNAVKARIDQYLQEA